ncbi:ATP-binding protein [Kribbella sp. NPDC056861]|uniref:sensor histidine kinase n=1 Tax=Kribbella sp. NPDC056861 TaxID=3154857 RepID=UPI003420F55C
MTDDKQPAFTVDTGLFRQLGELLVGRDATALVELIKNSYDADATSVLVSGQYLDDQRRAVLKVVDDGVGMTSAQFRRGFLTLAARSKTAGDRRSPIYQRRFTGEKGVGRLAAHKLASHVAISSVAGMVGSSTAAGLRQGNEDLDADELIELLRGGRTTLVKAEIDWDVIERVETLDKIKNGLSVSVSLLSRMRTTGTTLALSRLRHSWTSDDRQELVRQLNNFESPTLFSGPLPAAVRQGKLLFLKPTVRDSKRADPGFELRLEDEFALGQEYWPQVERNVEWVMEMSAQRGKDIQYSLAPTKNGKAKNPFGRRIAVSGPHPSPDTGPFFDSRIYLRSGSDPTIDDTWGNYNSGIRVYLEGFRVLPYGEYGNDWLHLDRDAVRRAGRFELDPLLAGPEDDLHAMRDLKSRDVSLRFQPNRNYFGAVFLTDAGSAGLRTLVNREGFVPDETYERLVKVVRGGVDVLQRAWALAGIELKTQLAAEARRERIDVLALRPGREETDDSRNQPSTSVVTLPTELVTTASEDDDSEDPGDENWSDVTAATSPRPGSAARLLRELAELRRVLDLPPRSTGADAATGGAVPPALVGVDAALTAVEEAADSLIGDASLLRVLATLGTQLSAFSHEISQLVPAVVAVERILEPKTGQRAPREVVRARGPISDIRRALERQASYLGDVASSEARRRRSRQRLRERVDVAFRGLFGSAAALDIELVNEVPERLRTPPIFKSELQGILTNLLTNAIKAAGQDGQVQVDASENSSGMHLVVQNTGASVDPTEAEGWFVPYASSSVAVDPVLGQGMGLGLPITRDLVSEYGGTVRFVEPGDGFATAIEVVIPE